jgi:L-aspartate oxidase
MIYKTCLERGLDITKDNIPVAPAAHYFMGGIKTDVFGKTNITGLFAAGECASTGVHGANRLASNSLLEGLVFGHRVAASAKECMNHDLSIPAAVSDHIEPALDEEEINRFKLLIKTAMWNGTGILRSEESLQNTLNKLNSIKDLPKTIEIENMLLVSKLITQFALERTESRGAQYRSDYPKTDDKNWKRHIVH